jgi:hypothetical protein
VLRFVELLRTSGRHARFIKLIMVRTHSP